MEKGMTKQSKISNSNTDPSTSRTASITSATQKCLSCKDSTEIIRLQHIINGRVTQIEELITSLLNSRIDNIVQDNDPKEVDTDIPAQSYIELMEWDKKLSDKNIRQFMVILI